MSGFLSSMVGATYAAEGPPPAVPNTWSSYTYNTAFTSVRRYTGLATQSIAFHGVYNTDKLVMTFIVGNSAGSSHSYGVGVFDLDTRVFAKSSLTSFGTSFTAGNYFPGSIAANVTNAYTSSEYGVITAFKNNSGHIKINGYTLSGLATCSTSSLPTLTLGAEATITTAGFGDPCCVFVSPAGTGGTGGRFAVTRRDNVVGDYNAHWVYNHNGASAPTIYKTASTGGSQGSGKMYAVRSGIDAANFATFYSFAGNNNNSIADHFRQGNASNDKLTISDGGFGSFGGNSFTASMIKDVSGDVIIMSQVNASGTPKHSLARWTNANSPTANPSVTRSTVRTWGNLYNTGFCVAGDLTTATTTHRIYLPVSDNNAMRFDYVDATSGSGFGLPATVTTGLTSGAGTYPSYYEVLALPWYNSTYGQYVISWAHHYDDDTVDLTFHKFNP